MTNSRSEARAREVLRQHIPAGRLTAFGESNVIKAMLAFTEPAAAMPGAPSREAIVSAIRAYSDEHRTWPLTENMIADALANLSPSHSGETGEVVPVPAKVVEAFMRNRVGELPGRGWLRDNDEVRRAVNDLALAYLAASKTPNDGGRDDASNEQREEG